ncbi:unnamed protein product [Hymenolepis diminuta]|uniref:Uncharacterized protein n=1 Tax=Hymenolepis diminuta TaxID=6216 RepID=A0A564ZBQ3_HYMDI|nr:unnamed protein product [Hymenolepis diminuta]
MDFLEKQQTRILLDKHKLVLNGTTELKLGRELPSLGSRMVNTQGTKSQKSSSREKILLTEIADTSEEVQAFLSNNEDIFALDGEPTGRSSIIKHTIDTGDAKPVALRPQRTPVQYQEFTIVISMGSTHSGDQKEKWSPSALRRLSQTKRCHKT